MAWVETAYTLALMALRPGLALAGRGTGKLGRGVRGRRETARRMADWPRVPERPLVWFHAPSVGEGLQARAVLDLYRQRNPDSRIAFTFFSPSAERLAASMPADFVGYLPLDLPADTARALDLLRPDAVIFSKTDVWPNLTREADRRRIPLALLSATLPASSSRLRGPARAFLRPAYSRLAHVAAISPADAARFESLGVPRARVSVMGDAHFDRVLARTARVSLDSEPLSRLPARPGDITLVAGSTWPADEERLLPVLKELGRLAHPGRLRVILVPHEPTREHLGDSERRMARLGLRARRLSALQGAWSGDEILLVDRVGVLGDLYALADLAYVGGGWGRSGLHSVLEPAAFGVPVVFGPRHSNAREAGELVAGGGALSSRPGELRQILSRLVVRPAERAEHGAAARRYVEGGRGAAWRGVDIIERLLAGGRGASSG